MASTSENENSVLEEVSLIDILYKDEYRIDSYLAQMMSRILKRSKIQRTESQTDTKKVESSLKIIGGSYSDVGETTVMEENRFVPHDRNVITLLELLNLEPQELLHGDFVGRLICLKGRLAVRDFRKFTEILPVMAENSQLFNIDTEEAKKVEKVKKTFDALAKIIPMNVEAEIVLKDNSIVRGILKEKYLLTAYQDIIATHGTSLPGIWCIVGIIDTLNKSTHPTKPPGFRKSMDDFSAVAETLYREENPKYTITPFLIFRGLEK